MSDGFEISRVSTIEKTHKLLRRAETDEYGPFKIFKHHATDELVLVKEKTTNSKVELTHEISSVERRYNFRHPNLLDMVDWSVDKKSQMCATFYKIKTFFKFHPTTLNMLISKRRKTGNMLDDTEIMQLTYDGVDALGYLQSQNISHGYLRPELVAVESNGQFVICDKLLEGTSRDAHLFAYRTKKDIYSSPAMWDEMVNDRRARHNGYKDDAFSFGLVLLYAANLVPAQDIYERNGRINEVNLQRHVKQATAKYHNVPLFGQILRKLLSLNEKDRWDFLTLMSSMPTRQQIQYYFTNYNNDSYFEDPEFIESSRMNATQVTKEYQKMANGKHVHGAGTMGLDPLTGKILKNEHVNRYELGGSQASQILNGTGLGGAGMRFSNKGGISSHNENPLTRKNMMRDRVKAPEQFGVPRPGKIDYSLVGDRYVNMKHNQTINNMTSIAPSEVNNFTTTTYKDPNDVTYDFDGQKNKHAANTEEVSEIHTPPQMNLHNNGQNPTSGLVFQPQQPLQPVHHQNMPMSHHPQMSYQMNPQQQPPKKQSLKNFLDNFANQDGQRISQNTHQPPIPAQHPTPQMNYGGNIPPRGQGQNPILQKAPGNMGMHPSPQYRQHGRGRPPQVLNQAPMGSKPVYRQPPQSFNQNPAGRGNYGFQVGGGGNIPIHSAGQEKGFMDPTKIGRLIRTYNKNM